MLRIKNYDNILNKTFGKYIITKAEEKPVFYNFEGKDNESGESYSVVVWRDAKMDLRAGEDLYEFSVISYDNTNLIEDSLYKFQIEDLELFCETIQVYFDTI